MAFYRNRGNEQASIVSWNSMSRKMYLAQGVILLLFCALKNKFRPKNIAPRVALVHAVTLRCLVKRISGQTPIAAQMVYSAL